jgi:tripartite-type tricarboxylate transporter receptor subunit TctC
MLRRTTLAKLLATALAALALPLAAIAQTQPVKILVGFPAGGSADITARVIADKMKDTLGVPVLVENASGKRRSARWQHPHACALCRDGGAARGV